MARSANVSEVASIERDLVMTVAAVGGGEKARLLKQALNNFWAQHPLDRPDTATDLLPSPPVTLPSPPVTLNVIEGGNTDLPPVPSSPTSLKEPAAEEDMTERTWRETLSDLLPQLPAAFLLDDLMNLSDEFRFLLGEGDPRKQVGQQLDLLVVRRVLTKTDDRYEAVP